MHQQCMQNFIAEECHFVRPDPKTALERTGLSSETGGRLNIVMPSYQYRDPHVKDKTIPSMGMTYLERRSLYWNGPLDAIMMT